MSVSLSARTEGGLTRVAIVTGADSGIGRATAIALARAGFDIGITWYEDKAGAGEAIAEIRDAGVNAAARPHDLTNLPGAADAVDDLAEALGGVHVFVNNAGTSQRGPFLELSLEEWRRVLDVNLTGAFLCAQRAAARMVGQGAGGRIINITSVHEHVPLQGAAAYCAAKGGLGLLTKVMALELAPHRITVNAVAPGAIATPMTGLADVDPHTVTRPGIPAGRPGAPQEVASAIAYLASDDAGYVTGESFVVDGGLSLMAAVRQDS